MSQDFVDASTLDKKERNLTFMDGWRDKYRRTEEEIKRETDVCPFASKSQFMPDLVRYCLFRVSGGSCQGFRIKPFEACPALR